MLTEDSKFPGQRQRDLVLTAQQVAEHELALVPISPKFRVTGRGLDGWYTYEGFASQPESIVLMECGSSPFVFTILRSRYLHQPHHSPPLQRRKLRHRGLQVVEPGSNPAPSTVRKIMGSQRYLCPIPKGL